MTTIVDIAEPIHLLNRYKSYVEERLSEKQAGVTLMRLPKLDKIIITTTVGSKFDKNDFKSIGEFISLIAGQKPIITKARKSVAAFKMRQGMDVGYKVTLRKHAMFDFLSRFVYITLPRIRDFKGLSKNSFDKNFNYNIGLKDCSSFHEIDVLNFKEFGLQVNLTLKNIISKEEGVKFLQKMLLPLK